MSKIHEIVENRTIEEALHILETKATIRDTAKKFGVSKSTVAKDMTDRLPEICALTAIGVREVLDYNKDTRHIRGGQATKEKYKQ